MTADTQLQWDSEQATSFRRRLLAARSAIADTLTVTARARAAYLERRALRDEAAAALLAVIKDGESPADLVEDVLDLRHIHAEQETHAEELRQQWQLARARQSRALSELLALIDGWRRPLPLFDRPAAQPELLPPAAEPVLQDDPPGLPEPPLDSNRPAAVCHRCGSTGGVEVDMPSQMDADDDLCPADMVDCELLAVLGIPEDEAAGTWLCGRCWNELTRTLAGDGKPRKGRKGKMPPLPAVSPAAKVLHALHTGGPVEVCAECGSAHVPEEGACPPADCGLSGPSGTVCTRETGHKGEHRWEAPVDSAICSVRGCKKRAVVEIGTEAPGHEGVVFMAWYCAKHRPPEPATVQTEPPVRVPAGSVPPVKKRSHKKKVPS